MMFMVIHVSLGDFMVMLGNSSVPSLVPAGSADSLQMAPVLRACVSAREAAALPCMNSGALLSLVATATRTAFLTRFALRRSFNA